MCTHTVDSTDTLLPPKDRPLQSYKEDIQQLPAMDCPKAFGHPHCSHCRETYIMWSCDSHVTMGACVGHGSYTLQCCLYWTCICLTSLLVCVCCFCCLHCSHMYVVCPLLLSLCASVTCLPSPPSLLRSRTATYAVLRPSAAFSGRPREGNQGALVVLFKPDLFNLHFCSQLAFMPLATIFANFRGQRSGHAIPPNTRSSCRSEKKVL